MNHQPCPDCKSSDALAKYEDHNYCFSCEKYTDTEKKEPDNHQPLPRLITEKPAFLPCTYEDIPERGIPADVCKRFNYGLNGSKQVVNIYSHRDLLVAQKVRDTGKKFYCIGKPPDTFIGQHVKSHGQHLIITEGEIDMLSWATVFYNCPSYHCVSVPKGVQSAKRVIARQLDYLKNFKNIYLSFDHDEHGEKATKEVCALLTDMHLKVIELPCKDANEVLLKHGQETLTASFRKSKSHRPEKALRVADLIEEAIKPIPQGFNWFDYDLNRLFSGRQKGGVYLIGAGTGCGKTDFITQQIAYDINALNKKVAVFYMEMAAPQLLKRVAGKIHSKLLHTHNANYKQEELKKYLSEDKINNNLHVWDCFGTTNWQELEQAVIYYVSQEIDLFYIDNLTALATGKDRDEKRELEHIMSRFATLAKRYQITFHVISHLTAPEKGSHEEGAKVSIRHFKGSRSIGYWATGIIGLERNQQDFNVQDRNTVTVRILKERITGEATGKTTKLFYNHQNGMMQQF